VKAESATFGDTSQPMVSGPFSLCGTELINLILLGSADGNVAAYASVGGGKVPAREDVEVGILTNEEEGVPVADHFKAPKNNVWVVHGGDHFTMLFEGAGGSMFLYNGLQVGGAGASEASASEASERERTSETSERSQRRSVLLRRKWAGGRASERGERNYSYQRKQTRSTSAKKMCASAAQAGCFAWGLSGGDPPNPPCGRRGSLVCSVAHGYIANSYFLVLRSRTGRCTRSR
jgi:hypothetical protein